LASCVSFLVWVVGCVHHHRHHNRTDTLRARRRSSARA
jgi:hypothetical protein